MVVKKLLSSDTCVRDTIFKMTVTHQQGLFDKGMNRILSLGGGVTCEAVKVEKTGAKYFDFIVHFIQYKTPTSFSMSPEWSIEQQTLILERCSGFKTADALKRLKSQRLYALYGVKLE